MVSNPPSTPIPRLIWKIIIIGDESCGKTSLVRQYVSNKFEGNYIPTLGANISKYSTFIEIAEKRFEVLFSIWDIAGQDNFRIYYKTFFEGASAAIVMFDLTRPKTFTHVEKWVQEALENHLNLKSLILVGNKSDLTEKIAVSELEIRSMQQALVLDQYYPTSALTGENVSKLFQSLAFRCYHLRHMMT
jgi:small GTP-binding protein